VFGDPQYAMKGLIWHSPGFFFSPDLSDPQSIPPVCLCSGSQDFTSIVQTNLLNNNLSSSGIPYQYIAMLGVGHTMDYPAFVQTMRQCIDFIDAQYSTNVDIVGVEQSMRVVPNLIRAGELISLQGNYENNAEIHVIDMTGKSAPFTIR